MAKPAKVLTDMPVEFVRCRTFGHQWDTFQPLSRVASWGTLLSLRCERCGMERYDTIDSIGAVSVRTYTAPDGYTYPGGLPFDRSDLRREVVRRMRANAARRLKSVS